MCKGAGLVRCTGCFGKGTTMKFETGIHSAHSKVLDMQRIGTGEMSDV